jgi:hypothetical protein
MSLKDKIFSSVAVSAFFVLTAFVFAPSQIFLTNVREFNASYSELLGYLSVIALPFFLLIVILIAFLPKNLATHQKIVVFLLSLSFLMWLQGNILVWDYGLLTGSKIDFNIYFLLFDAAVWLAVIIFVHKKYAFFYKHVKFISCVFIVVLISTSIFIYVQTDIPKSNRYEVDVTNEFTFSEEKNVIILVLDSFQSDLFQKIIDEDVYYKDIFDGFTYYRDSLSGFPTTITSVPNILTGQYYDNSVPFSDFLERAFISHNSIPKVLTDEGFEVDCFAYNIYPDVFSIYLDKRVMSNVKDRTGIETATIINIYDAAFFRYTPDFLKRYIYNDGRWFLKNFVPSKLVVSSDADDMRTPVNVPQITFDEKSLTLQDVAFINDMMTYSNTVDGRYIFKFYHLRGCHPPYLLNEELEYEEMHGADACERQAKASLQITNLFLDELKRLEVFDNSMIFVIADHGTIGADIPGQAYPLFLVKKFNSKGQMTVSDAPVSLSDIPKTIFSELGLKGDFTGESIFNLEESGFRERRFLYYEWEHSYWFKDYLPPMEEFIVSGHVWSSESWRSTGRELIAEFAEKPLLEWEDGFSVLEATADKNWRWCSSEGTLIINNTTNKDRKFIMIADFFTGHPELSNLKIESTLVNENLKINISGYHYEKEIIIPPGSHAIKFSCDAERVDAPADLRYLVFRVENFQMVEIE